MIKMIEVSIKDINVVKELYPRLKEDADAIARYKESIDNLPPITIAHGKEATSGIILVDGYHRLQIYKSENREVIFAEDLGELSDAEIFEQAIKRNSSHGQQLSQKDKKEVVKILWPKLFLLGEGRKKHLAELLSVSESSIDRYSKDARKDEEQQNKDLVKAMWLDCSTQEQIRDKIGIAIGTINDWINGTYNEDGTLKVFGFRQLMEYENPPESRQHFDVWNFSIPKDEKTNYFGAMPPQVVENLLWLYTEPGDTIFDPFAGSGTTINVAKRMGRPIWASDRKPYTGLLPIHQHDIVTGGYPDDAPKQNVKFILLDPPYWIQARGKYSEDSEDMGNMDIQNFTSSWDSVVKTCGKKLTKDGHLAFIVSPAEVKDENQVVDLAHLMYNSCEKVGLKPERRIIVTYSTQQATGQQVTWARENKKLLKLYRDLVIFKKE